MGKINCIIIEDEAPAQDVLTTYIGKTDWLSLSAVFEDAITAMDYLKHNPVDLIFLDIQIPGITGIQFLKALKKKPDIIITTAYADHAVEAFELEVRDYLKKPISFDRFLKSVDRITKVNENSPPSPIGSNANAESGFGFFNVNKMKVKVMFKEIRYIESVKEYVYIHLESEKIATKISISDIENYLEGKFVRIHRSFIVNADKITAYNAEEIFINKVSLPIGTNYKKLVSMVLAATTQ
jgi:two-component system, LytTR family, response regulator